MANASWPTDPVPNGADPNAFSGLPKGGPLLNHVHLAFAVPNPGDTDAKGVVLAGATLSIVEIPSDPPVGYVLVYVFNPDDPLWNHIGGPQVLALAPYASSDGTLTLQTTMPVLKANLRPIGIENLQAWRSWLAAFQALGGGGGTGNQGDGNAHP